jgi:hypothetical protein
LACSTLLIIIGHRHPLDNFNSVEHVEDQVSAVLINSKLNVWKEGTVDFATPLAASRGNRVRKKYERLGRPEINPIDN